MSDNDDLKTVDLGNPDPEPAKSGWFGTAELIGALLTAIWLGGALLFLTVIGLGEERTPGTTLALYIAVLFPVAALWFGVLVARSIRQLTAETNRLAELVEHLSGGSIPKSAPAAQTKVAAAATVQDDSKAKPKPKMKEAAPAKEAARPVAKAALKAVETKREEPVALSFSRHKAASSEPGPASQPLKPVANEPKVATAAAPPPPKEEPVPEPAKADKRDQGMLFGESAELRDKLTNSEYVRAFNFPRDTSDERGFRALRKAMKNAQVAQALRASQDVLTLFSEDGIYMDDLTPDRAHPDLWRRFAKGERGSALAAVGGIRDRTALALITQKMREDPIFRDSAHHFLRNFDTSLQNFVDEASDEELMRFADTRSARAFMVLARAAGNFD